MTSAIQKNAYTSAHCTRIFPFAWLLLMPLLALLTGCGAYYNVSVDSLSETAATEWNPYYLQPGYEDVSEDDLLFRDVCRMVTPAFTAKGMAITNNIDEARSVARITYWEEEPRSTWVRGTTTRSVPVVLRDGRKQRVEYVQVEEPTLTEHTVYTVGMLIEAFANTPQSGQKSLWRTTVRCSGSTGHMRTLLTAMVPALRRTLATRTPGGANFEVFISDKGEISIDEVSNF